MPRLKKQCNRRAPLTINNFYVCTLIFNFYFLKKITYIGTSSEKYEINDGICKTSCSDTLTPHAIFLWRNAVMKLPKSLPATDLGGCNIIKVEYTLEVTVGEGSSFCAPKERYEVPIKIGSTPLSNTACYIQKLEASPMMIQQ